MVSHVWYDVHWGVNVSKNEVEQTSKPGMFGTVFHVPPDAPVDAYRAM